MALLKIETQRIVVYLRTVLLKDTEFYLTTHKNEILLTLTNFFENGIQSWHIDAGNVQINASTDEITESETQGKCYQYIYIKRVFIWITLSTSLYLYGNIQNLISAS